MQKVFINEEWRSISGYINYQVSNIGRVRNEAGHILKPCTSHDGYLHIKVWLNGKYKHVRIHRLLAQEFIPNPNNKPIVDHIDSVRTNNTIGNLRWATNSESNIHIEKRHNTISKYTGVYRERGRTSWRAQIYIDGKRLQAGSFKSEEEAALAYNEKAIEHHKEFALLNVIG